MKAFANMFVNLFTGQATSEIEKIYREWDIQRSQALGPNDLAEIDAIFARHLGAS